MSTTAETFGQQFAVLLALSGYQVPALTGDTVSHITTDWRTLNTAFTLSQFNCWTERYIGPLEYSAVGRTQRKPVIRLKMDFWRRLADTESEEDVIGPSGLMHSDFSQWGAPEYWKDTYPSDPSLTYSILGVDMEQGAPEFAAESIEGILMHWSISIGLIGVP